MSNIGTMSEALQTAFTELENAKQYSSKVSDNLFASNRILAEKTKILDESTAKVTELTEMVSKLNTEKVKIEKNLKDSDAGMN